MVYDFSDTTVILQLHCIYPSCIVPRIVHLDHITMEVNALENGSEVISRGLVESNAE